MTSRIALACLFAPLAHSQAATTAPLASDTGTCSCGMSTTASNSLRWSLTTSTGYLWQVGHSTKLPYEIQPLHLILRSPVAMTWWTGSDGSSLVVRNRFGLVLERIRCGPESHFAGLNAAPSIEWRPAQGPWSCFASAGGGLGTTNSDTHHGGLGNDLIFHWFGELGVRRRISPNTSLEAAAYFTHHSDGGRSNPNPGIDALGFTLGIGTTF